jgi:hypothetical protein
MNAKLGSDLDDVVDVDIRLARAGWRLLARRGLDVAAVRELIAALPRLQAELAALTDGPESTTARHG